MMNIQIPPANFGNGHIVTAKFRRLHVPDDVFAVVVLVPHFHHGRGDAVHALPIHVQPIPRISEFYHWIRLERFLEQDALDCDSQMD